VPVYQTLPGDRSTWISWGRQLHWLALDYSYGPPPPGNAIIIDSSLIPVRP